MSIPYIPIQPDDFPLRLAQIREAQEISACAMSYDLGHNRNYINGIELQKYLPSLPEFIEICNYLRVAPNDLLLPPQDAPKSGAKLESIPPTQLMLLCKDLTPEQSAGIYQMIRVLLS